MNDIYITSYRDISMGGQTSLSLASLLAEGVDPAAFEAGLDHFVTRRVHAGIFAQRQQDKQAALLAGQEKAQANALLAERAGRLKDSGDLAALRELAADVARPAEERRVRTLQAKRAALLAEVAQTENALAAAQAGTAEA